MRTIVAVVLACAVASSALASQGALQTEKLQSELILTTVAEPELTKRLTANGTFEHKSEITRGQPVAAVVRVPGCEKDAKGACRVSVDLVIYGPDSKVHNDKKNIQLSAAGVAVPLEFDAQTKPGVYRIVATIRDVVSRRFATVERQFGVK